MSTLTIAQARDELLGRIDGTGLSWIESPPECPDDQLRLHLTDGRSFTVTVSIDESTD